MINTITVKNSEQFKEAAWKLEEMQEGAVEIIIKGDVDYIHSVRFPKQKAVRIKSDDIKMPYKLNIPVEKAHHERDDEPNETQFFFGGDEKSRYLFENLVIDIIIDNHREENIDIKNMPEIIIMNVMHDCKLTFINCKFIVEDNQKRIIKIGHNAVCEFYGCEIPENIVIRTWGNGSYIKSQ